MKKIALLLFVIPAPALASVIVNPSKGATISTNTISAGPGISVTTTSLGVQISTTGAGGGSGTPGGSDTQVQYNNGGSFGGTTNPTYSNSTGLLSYTAPGYVMTDSAGCTWGMTVNTLGALVSTLISCPSPVVFVPCAHGIPVGLLLAITCP